MDPSSASGGERVSGGRLISLSAKLLGAGEEGLERWERRQAKRRVRRAMGVELCGLGGGSLFPLNVVARDGCLERGYGRTQQVGRCTHVEMSHQKIFIFYSFKL